MSYDAFIELCHCFEKCIVVYLYAIGFDIIMIAMFVIFF